jgi:FixJ family two-component response regulator
MSDFKLTPKMRKVIYSLADGATQKEAADRAGITDRTVRRWLNIPEFATEVDKVTLETGLATKAARLRLIKRVVNARLEKTVSETVAQLSKADTLELLKHLHKEQEGAQLNVVGDPERPIAYQIIYTDIDETDADLSTEAAPLSENGHYRGD